MTLATPEFTPRQEQLLSAAVRVLAHRGLRGLTHRAVDAEAGLPEGSCSAHMRTRLALLTRLTEYVTAQFARDITGLTQRIEDRGTVDGFVVEETVAMLRSWLQVPDLLLARIELTIEASRQPAVDQILEGQWDQLVAIVEHAMTTTDPDPDPDRAPDPARAETLLAAVDGVLLRALREPTPRRASFLHDSLELLIGTLVGNSTLPRA